MDKKEIRLKRMMSHFINATDELIKEVGINGLSIRKIAKRAGFNSATIYNYFKNLDHLIFYASMKNIKDYSLALSRYLANTENSMDRFLKVWECFSDYAFSKPEIYNAVFFSDMDEEMEEHIQKYYEFFDEEFGVHSETISAMLLKSNIKERGMTPINDCIKDGYIREEDGDKLNDMTLLVFEGMLKRVLLGKASYEDARNKTLDYIKHIVKIFLLKDYEFKF